MAIKGNFTRRYAVRSQDKDQTRRADNGDIVGASGEELESNVASMLPGRELMKGGIRISNEVRQNILILLSLLKDRPVDGNQRLHIVKEIGRAIGVKARNKVKAGNSSDIRQYYINVRNKLISLGFSVETIQITPPFDNLPRPSGLLLAMN